VALDDGAGVLGIQACAGASASARLTKAMEQPELQAWLARGNRFQVWAWRKAGARGKRKTWQVRIIDPSAVKSGERGREADRG
jgi:hypothetical protein